ncbi:hypothetical protein SISNIDRAFT_29492 [Sistotremastrum niveocremeum HHB9708]|uniref:Uncharacterized protein n=1 Tax=Sistotremastrum niveocremeum HHB9708 TaxID=1314777 RepID=A0A164W3S9_9AGAM|nr:hypothetical protein SISNIDRAFT_29492 [Sistotremastrum niveocremeum HHB9708]
MGWNLRNFFSKVNTSLPKPDPRPPFHDASQRRRLRQPTVTAAQTTHTNTLFSTFFVDSSADALGNRYRSSLVFEEGPFGPIPPMNDLPGTGEYRVRKAYPRVDNSVPPFSAPPAVTSHRPHVLTRKPRTRFVSMPAPQRDYPNLDDEAGYWPTDPPRPNAQTLRHRPPIPTTADLDGMRRRAMSHPPSSWNEQTLHKASGPRTVGERRPLRTFSNDPRRIGTINRQFRIYDGTLMADGAGYVDTVRGGLSILRHIIMLNFCCRDGQTTETTRN